MPQAAGVRHPACVTWLTPKHQLCRAVLYTACPTILQLASMAYHGSCCMPCSNALLSPAHPGWQPTPAAARTSHKRCPLRRMHRRSCILEALPQPQRACQKLQVHTTLLPLCGNRTCCPTEPSIHKATRWHCTLGLQIGLKPVICPYTAYHASQMSGRCWSVRRTLQSTETGLAWRQSSHDLPHTQTNPDALDSSEPQLFLVTTCIDDLQKNLLHAICQCSHLSCSTCCWLLQVLLAVQYKVKCSPKRACQALGIPQHTQTHARMHARTHTLPVLHSATCCSSSALQLYWLHAALGMKVGPGCG